MVADLESPGRMAEATLAYEFGQVTGAEPKKRKMGLILQGAAALIAVVAGGAYMLFSGRQEDSSELTRSLAAIEKEGLSPATRSAGAAPGAPQGPGAPSG